MMPNTLDKDVPPLKTSLFASAGVEKRKRSEKQAQKSFSTMSRVRPRRFATSWKYGMRSSSGSLANSSMGIPRDSVDDPVHPSGGIDPIPFQLGLVACAKCMLQVRDVLCTDLPGSEIPERLDNRAADPVR